MKRAYLFILCLLCLLGCGKPVVPANSIATGKTVDDVCAGYADYHFDEVEKVSERTFHVFSSPVFDEGGMKAQVEFLVRYKHWGYTQQLYIEKHGGLWYLTKAVHDKDLTFDVDDE